MDKYELLPGIRRSDLWKLNKSPFHFKYSMEHPIPQTPSLLFGAAAHKLVLETDDFFNSYALSPVLDRRTKEGKAEWAAFVAHCEEKHLEVIPAADYEMIKEMSAAIDAHPIARKLLTGEHEQIFTWIDPLTGEACKVKVDCITEFDGKKYIVDYKTTDSCEDGHFERSCRRYGYKFQAGMYREGVFQNTLDQYSFAFVAQEKTEPFAVRVYFCTDEWIDEGYDDFRWLIGLYHDCKTKDRWPGYEDEQLLQEG